MYHDNNQSLILTNLLLNMTTLSFRAVGRTTAVAMLGFAAMFSTNAATIVVDGITYSTSGTTATVAKDANYSGDLVIPATVTHEGTTYNVTKVAATAFKNNANITGITLPDGITVTPRGMCQGCTGLKTMRLPQDLVTMNQDAFSGCSALTEISIPATLSKLLVNTFQGCTSLAKITFTDSETAIELPAGTAGKSWGIFGTTKPAENVLAELYIGREITVPGATGPAVLPWTNIATLKKVVYTNNTLTAIGDYTFQNCTSLAEATLPTGLTTLGAQAFLGTGLTSIDIPAGVTTIGASTFQGCGNLAKVTMGDGVTSIGDMAFYNSGLAEFTFPSALTKIGAYAFDGTKLAGVIALPAAVQSIGANGFANNANVTGYSIPASVTSIGSAAFKNNPANAAFTVAEGNTAYKVLASGALVNADGSVILNYPAAAAATAFADETATEIDAYAFYGAKNLTSISLPKVAVWGDYSLAATGMTEMSVSGAIGRYLFANSPALQKVSVAGAEVPFGICSGCTALTEYNCLNDVTIVRQEAFKGCTSLKNLDLGGILVIIESDAFAGISPMNMTVRANTPAALGIGVFVEGTPITVTVPVELVDTYKNAAGWQYLTIQGDANLAVGPTDMGMPDGLYYAGVDGNLHCVYEDGQSDMYDVGGVPHTFQLTQFKNRIYGASAGKKFVYSGTSGNEGDGKLFYISQISGNIFQATVLDNAGNNAYKDPFGLYIYGDTLYVNDRNVCVRKIAADAIALPQDYKSWVENNWLAYYDNQWAYGCIKSGFAITQDKDANGNPEPLYWLGMKYNGNGIFRFKEAHVGTDGSAGRGGATGYSPIFNASAPIFTTFYIDEANGHIYIYFECANYDATAATYGLKGGLYRFNLADIEANPEPAKILDLPHVLIDGAPVFWEGAGANEHVGIPQLSPDEKGEYLYWCYRAPSASDVDNVAKGTPNYYPWAEDYNAENPLHKTGIKRVALGAAEPKVELVVEGVEGYGIVPVNYEGSSKPSGVNEILTPGEKTAYDRVLVAGNSFTVTDAAVVKVYSANGSVVLSDNVVAGGNVTVEGVAGVYVIEAIFADGAKQTVKIAVK